MSTGLDISEVIAGVYVRYSSVCETDVGTYNKYLDNVERAFAYGRMLVGRVGVCGDARRLGFFGEVSDGSHCGGFEESERSKFSCGGTRSLGYQSSEDCARGGGRGSESVGDRVVSEGASGVEGSRSVGRTGDGLCGDVDEVGVVRSELGSCGSLNGESVSDGLCSIGHQAGQGFNYCLGFGERRSEGASARVSGSDVGRDGGGLGGIAGDAQFRQDGDSVGSKSTVLKSVDVNSVLNSSGCQGGESLGADALGEKAEGVPVVSHSVRLPGQILRGKNFEKNKAKRDRKYGSKKNKKKEKILSHGKVEVEVFEDDVPEWRKKVHKVGYFEGCDVDKVKLLKESRMDALIAKNEREVLEHKRATAKATGKDSGLGLETKWKAENRLAELRAIREVEIMGALDVRDEVRRKRAQVTAATEKNLVSIEMAHGSLVKSGNASEDDSSRINTVFSIGSGSISPNSSISEAEVRKLQKDFEDLKVVAVNDKKKRDEKLRSFGFDPEAPGAFEDEEEVACKSMWTVEAGGMPTAENDKILDKLYPDGYGVTDYDDEYDEYLSEGELKEKMIRTGGKVRGRIVG